jgi:hypothetical protein
MAAAGAVLTLIDTRLVLVFGAGLTDVGGVADAAWSRCRRTIEKEG